MDGVVNGRDRVASAEAKCPKCSMNNSLLIKNLRGWERIVALLTRTRRYRCDTCGHAFRGRRGDRDHHQLTE